PAILRPQKPVGIPDLQEAGLERFISRYIKQDEDGSYKSVTYLFPAQAESRRKAPPALVEALDHPAGGIEITGTNIASAELKRIFSRDAWRAVILGMVLVTFLLWLDFRSLWLTALAHTH